MWGRAARQRRLDRMHSIEDLRRAARCALPRMVFDFVDGGAGAERTIAENRRALDRVRLVPSGPVDVTGRSQAVTLFGARAEMPVVLGPTGGAGGLWPQGDQALAAAAARFGIPFVLTNNANATPEQVAAASGAGRRWFQLYMQPDREACAQLLDRVAAAGFEAAEVTVDTAVPGRRLRDLRNGFSLSPAWTPARLAGLLARPGWLARTIRHGPPRMVLMGEPPAGAPRQTLAERVRHHLNPSLSWHDLAWLRDRWRGPLLVKGVCDPRQAERAAALGFEGIVVSNHGGRQLDGAVAAIDMLPEIAAAVGGRMTLLVDGGFRTGPDILKALALGAAAVQLGRAGLYGLAVAGEPGVVRALTLLRDEIDVAQALCGVPDLSRLSPADIRTRHAARPTPFAPEAPAR